jgi:hypothetical protein
MLQSFQGPMEPHIVSTPSSCTRQAVVILGILVAIGASGESASVFALGTPVHASAQALAFGARIVQEEAATKPALPDAEKILDTFVEVTGGKKAYEKLKTRTASGTFSIAALGVKGKMQTWQKAPDRLRSSVEMGELGKSERGVERGVAWETSSLSGARILDGAEQAFLLREATFNADLNWRKLCKSVQTVGAFEVAGKPAWKIEAKTNDEAVLHLYYDQYSNLLVRIDASVVTAMGEVAVEVYPSDYRKVGAILVPHKSTQKMLGITQVAEFDSIVFNQPIADEKFAPPADVKNLLTAHEAKASGAERHDAAKKRTMRKPDKP